MLPVKIKYILACFVLEFIILILGLPYKAKIDAKSIVGIWLMESDRQVADMSKNGNYGEVKGNLKLVDVNLAKHYYILLKRIVLLRLSTITHST